MLEPIKKYKGSYKSLQKWRNTSNFITKKTLSLNIISDRLFQTFMTFVEGEFLKNILATLFKLEASKWGLDLELQKKV